MQHRLKIMGVTLLLAGCQNQPHKTTESDRHHWQLIPQQSALSFVSTKNKTFTEEHSVKFKQGQINEKMAFNASIDLNTIDSQIPIRDQRMRDIPDSPHFQ